MKQNQDAIAEYTAIAQLNEYFYHSNFEVNTSMMGLIVPDLLCIESQNRGELLSEMVKEKPLLVFRLIESSCKPCYIDFLTLLYIFSAYLDTFIFHNLRCFYIRISNRPKYSDHHQSHKNQQSCGCFTDKCFLTIKLMLQRTVADRKRQYGKCR